jgi:carbonic anhydrase/acetyltransferase-like protein (isoleucine patch superfamily)
MLYRFEDKFPVVHRESFVAQSADAIGDVYIDEDASIWFGAVLRGDTNSIYVGKGSNIQDNCVLHANLDESPVSIGEYVTVGHSSILHGCKIGSHVLIGMGSTIMDGAEVGDYTMIGAGSLVTPGKKIPAGVLLVGSPAKVIRELTDKEKEALMESAEEYITISKSYIKE